MEASSTWFGIALSGDGLERKLFLQKQFELWPSLLMNDSLSHSEITGTVCLKKKIAPEFQENNF